MAKIKDPFIKALVHRLIRAEKQIAALARHSALQSIDAVRAYSRAPVSEGEVDVYVKEILDEAAEDESHVKVAAAIPDQTA